MWLLDDVLDAVAGAISREEDRLRDEQAVHGLDALDEVDLHPIIADGLANAGFGVLREQPYPREWTRKVDEDDPSLPEHRDRQRCDLVLTPESGQHLADDWMIVRQADRIRAAGEGTLFSGHAESDAVAHAPPIGSLMPDEAFWLEVKVVGQFAYRAGFSGANGTYSSELIRGATTDLSKLAADDMIASGALLLIVFTVDEATVEHDLVALLHKCLDKSLPIASHLTRSLPITERIGNSWCTPALIPVRKPLPPSGV